MPIHLIISVIAALLIAYGAAVVVAVGYLTMTKLRDWFRKYRQYLANRRFKKISLKTNREISEALRNDQVTHITGFFDTEDEELVEVQAWKAREVDPEVEQAHQGSKIVVWS
jgi:hypothetical protein